MIKEKLDNLNINLILKDYQFTYGFFTKDNKNINFFFKKKLSSLTQSAFVLSFLKNNFPSTQINLVDIETLSIKEKENNLKNALYIFKGDD